MDYSLMIIFLLLSPCYIQAQVPVTVCGDDSRVIGCGRGSISTSFAAYGRWWQFVCDYDPRVCSELIDVRTQLGNSCNGQMLCEVNAGNITKDPCPGFEKYLYVTYICEDGTITLEEEPAGMAEITSPNFGDSYSNSLHIIYWHVVAPMGSRIRLHFAYFATEEDYYFVSIFHGMTQLFNDATRRAHFSGNTVPFNVTSISSYMWIRFTTNDNNMDQGFRAVADVVIPDWACDFYMDNCGLTINPGDWTIGEFSNYYYIQTQGGSGGTSSFTIPYEFTSSEGILSFAYYQLDDGSLDVTVCGSQQRISDENTGLPVPYKYIPYSCEGTSDIEITFTATTTMTTYGFSIISVLDIQLYETSVDSTVQTTASPSTQGKSVSTAPATTSTHSPSSTQFTRTTQTIPSSQSSRSNIPASSPDVHTSYTSDSLSSTIASTSTNLQSPSRGSLSSAVIPAVSSIVVLLVIGLMIVAVFVMFVYRRRRFREPKPVVPRDQDDDDPSLYNNPVYVSKEDDFSTPDLLVGINFRNGSSVSSAPNGSPDVDNQYEDFDGDQKNTVKGGALPTNNSFSRAGRLHSSPEASQVNTVNTPMYHTLIDGPNSEAIYEEGDHTYEQAQRPIQPSRNQDEASKREKGTDDVENSSLASPVGGVPQGEMQDGGENRSSDGIAVLDDDEEYNALTFNQSSDITRALKKPKRVGDHANNGYGVLDLPQDKAASLLMNSAGLHNDDVYNSLDEPTVEQHNGKQSTTGERPNGKGDTVLQPGADSDYNNYQDPTQMDREGSGPRSPDLDVFSDDQYNILDSGKQVGDYHVYQSTNDNDGDYTELDTSKMNGEDEYSTIDLDQNHQSKATGINNFEPIYSDEIYSEFN